MEGQVTHWSFLTFSAIELPEMNSIVISPGLHCKYYLLRTLSWSCLMKSALLRRYMVRVRPQSALLIRAICDTLIKLAVRGPQVPALSAANIEGRIAAL